MIGTKKTIDWRQFYSGLDYDALYADLGWSPTTTIGSEDKGYCLDPWKFHKHGDRTGKLAINRDKGVYNCWVCGGGTILSLVMEVKGFEYEGAIEYLTRYITAYTKESSDEFQVRVAKLLAYGKHVDRPIPIFNSRVLDRYESGDSWAVGRGISADVAQYFKVRVHPGHTKFHPDHGAFEGHAAILPHFWQGKLVGWQERWISNTPKWVGRWTNTSDFPRETTVWGIDFARSQNQPVVLVESVPTALRLITEGFPAIATFGSQITPDQCRHLRMFQQGIILAPDNDSAGAKWYKTATQELDRYVPLFHIDPPGDEGDDLGDVSRDTLLATLADVKDTLSLS